MDSTEQGSALIRKAAKAAIADLRSALGPAKGRALVRLRSVAGADGFLEAVGSDGAKVILKLGIDALLECSDRHVAGCLAGLVEEVLISGCADVQMAILSRLSAYPVMQSTPQLCASRLSVVAATFRGETPALSAEAVRHQFQCLARAAQEGSPRVRALAGRAFLRSIFPTMSSGPHVLSFFLSGLSSSTNDDCSEEAARVLAAGVAAYAPQCMSKAAAAYCLASARGLYGARFVSSLKKGCEAESVSVSTAWAQAVEGVVQAAVRVILSSAGAPGPAIVSGKAVQCWGGVLACCGQGSFDKEVSPILAKALKSKTEVVMPIVGELLLACAVGADVSSICEEIIAGAAVSLSCAGKDESRPAAAAAVNAIARCFVPIKSAAESSGGIGKVVTGVIDLLTKNKSTVPLWQCRAGAVSLLHAAGSGLCDRCFCPTFSGAAEQRTEGTEEGRDAAGAKPHLQAPVQLCKLAGTVFNFIAAYVAKESDERVKAAAVSALGSWLPLLLMAPVSEAEDSSTPLKALPAELALFLCAGLKSSACAAGVDDGYAEAVYMAVSVGCDGGMPGQDTSAATAAAAAFAGTPTVSDALLDFVVRSASAALALGLKKQTGAPVGAISALASLVRISRHDSALRHKMAEARISADGWPGSVTAGSATVGAKGSVSTSAGPGSVSKKPAVNAAAPKSKSAAHPTTPTGSSVIPGTGISAGKNYSCWDLFTSAVAAPAILTSQWVISGAGRQKADVSCTEEPALAAVDAIFGALLFHLSDAPASPGVSTAGVTPYGKTMLAAVYADLLGVTAGCAVPGSSIPTGSEDAKTGLQGKTRSPTGLFYGLVAFLSHPSPVLRKSTCAGLQTLYAVSQGQSHPHAALPACLLHALWDKVRGIDLLAPRMSAWPDAADSGVGDGLGASQGLHAVVGANAWRMPRDAALAAGLGADTSSLSSSSGSYPFLPAPHTLQAALHSILGGKDKANPLGSLGKPADSRLTAVLAGFDASILPESFSSISGLCHAGLLLPTTLYMCSHAAVAGVRPDATGLTLNGAGAAAGCGGMLALAAEHPGIAGRGGDPSGRVSSALWSNSYATLRAACAIPPSVAGPTVAVGSALATAALPVHPHDALMARPEVAIALALHMQGHATGMWAVGGTGTGSGVAPSGPPATAHTMRTCAARVARLLCGPALRQRAPHASAGVEAVALAQALPAGSVGRSLALVHLLTPILASLHRVLTSDVSVEDVEIWRMREGVAYAPPPVEDHFGPSAALRNRRVPAFLPRGTRCAAPWTESLGADLAHARIKVSEGTAAKAAMERAKKDGMGLGGEFSGGRGGGAVKLSVSGPADYGRGGPASGVAGAVGKAAQGTGRGPGAREEDPAVLALRDQSSTRSRVQSLYASGVASLLALRAIIAGLSDSVAIEAEWEGGAASSSGGMASLASLPGLLTTLLPCLGHPLLSGHALLTVKPLLSLTLQCGTVLRAPWAPEGLISDWTRCLQVVQVSAVTRDSMIRALSTGSGGTPPSGTGVPASAFDTDGDALGAAGWNMTDHTGPLRRVLAVLLPRCNPDSGHSLGVGGGGGSAAFDERSALETAGFEGNAGSGQGQRGPTGPLPPPAFALLFPVLRAVLTSSPPLALAAPALAVLAPHVAPSPACTANPGSLLSACAQGRLASAGAYGSILAGPGASPPPLEVVPPTLTDSALAPPCLRLSVRLGSGLADGTGRDALSRPGPCSLHASLVAGAWASTALASVSAMPTSLDEASPACAYMLHKCLREALVYVVLRVVRTSPRSLPPPDALLLELVRGEGEHVGMLSNGEGDTLVPRALRTLTLGETGPLLGSDGLLSSFPHIRACCLNALDVVLAVHAPSTGLRSLNRPAASTALSAGANEEDNAPPASPLSVTIDDLLVRLWLCVHDEDEDNAGYASELWFRHACALPPSTHFSALLSLLSYPEEAVRAAAGRAVAGSLRLKGSNVDAGIKALLAAFTSYADAAALTVPAAGDARASLCACLAACASSGIIPVSHLPVLLPFIISKGLADERAGVRESALAAGRALVDAYGASHTRMLLPPLESFLEQGARSPLAAATEDRRDGQREGVVVLLGASAAYLHPSSSPAEASKVRTILKTLLDTLDTPSEPVQIAVSRVLPPLAKMAKADAQPLVTGLMTKLLKGDSYAQRRGAAFGLAGAVKGLGLPSLKTCGVLKAIEDAAGDGKNEKARQGALFACETLCAGLGFLVEPFVTRILPLLLRATGDSSADVRDASGIASKAVMRVLTGYGVKLIMPAVLAGLGEISWRSKTASIQLLGYMSFVSPKQLGSLLPAIVPELAKAFDDPHPRVQEAGRAALADIGRVIKNPEVEALVPALLAAIADPDKTKDALTALAGTAFQHAMDPASLALVMPVLRRGLADRATAVKTAACTISGAIVTLVGDPSDLMPYLPGVLPHLQKSVGDPIPDVRGAASGALGGLARGMGLDRLPDLLPWLVARLAEDSSTVERSGAAQALTEVLAALGEPTLSGTLTTLLPLANAPKPWPREGLLWLTVFLPPTLGTHGFAPLLPRLFPTVVGGLADDTECVRDVAARAGQVIVKRHARTDGKAVLPALEAGTRCPSWRIRQQAVNMIGSLLAEMAGTRLAPIVVAGNVAGEEEEHDDWASDDAADGPTLEDDEAAAAAAAVPPLQPESSAKSKDAAGDEAAEAAADFLAGRRGGPKIPFFKKEEREREREREEEAKKGSKDRGAGAGDEDDDTVKRKKGERGRPEDNIVLPSKSKSHKPKLASEGKLRALEAAEARRLAGQPEPDSEPEEEGLAGRRKRRKAKAPGAGNGEDGSDVIKAGGHTYYLSKMDPVTQAHVRLLGWEGRCRAMACLYLARSDTSAVVRQAALAVWKVLVTNAPKALRELLPALMPMLIDSLSGGQAGSDQAIEGAVDASNGVLLPGAALRDSSGTHPEERRLVAGRCLGDIVRKLGDRVLPEVIPILRAGLAPPKYSFGFAEARPDVVARDSARRRGVCLGLGEVVEAAGRSMIADFLPLVLPAVRDALCDRDAGVRAAAQSSFITLQKVVGRAALDGILPSLLAAVDTADEVEREGALVGLAGVVSVRPREVLPALLDRLLTPPMRLLQARALAAVAAVTGGSVLHMHMSALLHSMIRHLAGTEEVILPTAAARAGRAGGASASGSGARRKGDRADPALAQPSVPALPPMSREEKEAIAAAVASEDPVGTRLAGPIAAAFFDVMGSISSQSAAGWTASEIVKTLGDVNPSHRRASLALLHAFVSRVNPSDFAGQVPMLLKELINRGADTNASTLKGAWETLSALVNNTPAEDQGLHLDLVRSLLSNLNSDARYRRGGIGGSGVYHLPGLSLPKGLDAVLPIYMRALMHGHAQDREAAAAGLGEIIDLTAPEGLKAYYVKITGPLIRVVADKWPWGVKAAILGTLGKLITVGGAALRPFQPQLQATFVKGLSDQVQAVRTRGAACLGGLMPLSTRVDPLVMELAGAIEAAPSGVRESLCTALTHVFWRGGDKVTAPARIRALEALLPLAAVEDGSGVEDEGEWVCAGSAVGAVCRRIEPAVLVPLLPRLLLTSGEVDEANEDAGAASVRTDPQAAGKVGAVLALLRYAPATLAGDPAALLGPVVKAVQAAARHPNYVIRAQAARSAGFAIGIACAAPRSTTPALQAAGTVVAPVPVPSQPHARVPQPPAAEDLTAPVVSSFKSAVLSTLLPCLVRALSDSSADVRRSAITASGRVASLGWANAVQERAVGGALLPPVITTLTKDSGNYVLRSVSERALVHWTMATDPACAASSGPPSAALALLDVDSGRFLTDLWRKSLQDSVGAEGEDEDEDDALKG